MVINKSQSKSREYSKDVPELVRSLVDVQIKKSGSAKSVDGASFISSIVKHTIEALMEAEMKDHLDLCKSSSEPNSKNGYGGKTIKGDFGQVEISVPRDRKSTFEPEIVPKRSREIGDFSNKVISLYARGLTTREIQDHLEEMYGVDVSPQFISNATSQIQEQLEEWRVRPLDKVYPVVYLDGTFISVRDQETGRVVKKCLYVVLGVDTEGRLDVLSLEIDNTEGAKFWLQVLEKLKQRGVEDIFIACADGLKGFGEALGAVFPQADLQLCVVHQIRNATKFIPHKHKKAFCADMRKIYNAIDLDAAEIALDQLEEKWGKQYPAAISSWRKNWHALTTFFDYPAELRKMIYTTNRIENLNSRIKKNIKNRRQFNNDNSLLKIVFLNVRNISNKWNPVTNWSTIFNQLSLIFKERLIMNNAY